MQKIIDVSKWQGVINWQKVKGQIQGAVIRAGYGKGNVDPCFIQNIEGCISNNIPVGIYWFIYATNEKQALINANCCHETIKKYKGAISLKVWCDYEYDSDSWSIKQGVNQNKTTRTKIVKAFCERLEELGYEVGVYANPDYLNNKFDDLSMYPLWLAYYASSCEKYKEFCPIMWQYTSKGEINGITGNVDCNYLYDEIERKAYYDTPEFTLVECLKKIGVDSSYENRKKIALRNGIEGYKGTAQQNLQMLAMLNEGKLRK